MKKHSIPLAFLFILLSLSAGFVGSFFTIESISTWYSTLEKPFFSPPNWVFGPVWTTLYVLIGISGYLAYKSRGNSFAIKIFGLQLVLNTLWSIIFFGLKMPWLAFVEILVLLGVIVYLMKLFYKIDKVSAYLLIPYLLWVSFASILNLAIWLLN